MLQVIRDEVADTLTETKVLTTTSWGSYRLMERRRNLLRKRLAKATQ